MNTYTGDFPSPAAPTWRTFGAYRWLAAVVALAEDVQAREPHRSLLDILHSDFSAYRLRDSNKEEQ